MKDTLTSLRMQKRKVDTRVTNDNKQSIINQINKHSADNGYGKVSKNASVKEVTRMKNQYMESLTRDIVTIAIQQGKDIIAEIESRDLKKSDDYETKRLGEFGKALAKAKKESDKKLSNEENKFIEAGNGNIRGYGNKNILDLFDKTKTKDQAKELIKEISEQDAKQIYYNKQIAMIEKVFHKVEVVRENDLNKLKEKMKEMTIQEISDITTQLTKKLEMYDSDKQGVSREDETELADARLDDLLIQQGLKKSGIRKVNSMYKKYKVELKEKE